MLASTVTELVEALNENRTTPTLDLSEKGLTDSDVTVIAEALKTNKTLQHLGSVL